MTRDDYLSLMRADVRDTAGKLTDPDDFERALDDALARYGDLRPHLLQTSFIGDGSAVYPLPPEFVPGFSRIEGIGQSDDGLTVTDPLDREAYTIRPGISGEWYLTLTTALATGSTLYMTFTAPHAVTDTEDTVAPQDVLSVAKFGAAFACLKLAAHYAQTSEPTLGADVISYQSKAEQYLRLSKEYRQTANRHFGLKDDEPELLAASAHGDLDVTLSSGLPRFFHGWR